MLFRTFLLPLSLLAFAGADCDLCSGVSENLTCADTVIRPDGKTCMNLQDEAGIDDALCTDYQAYWSKACCVEDCPEDRVLAPSAGPLTHTPTAEPHAGDPDPDGVNTLFDENAKGDHPPCHLCYNGQYPGVPFSMAIEVLFIGVGNCHQFYHWLLNGNVVNHRCDAISYFAQEPCGCGSNKAPPQNTPRPTPAPVPAPAAIPQRRTPPEPKVGMKLGNQRGGAGAQYHAGRRVLKGDKSLRGIAMQQGVGMKATE